MGRDTLLYPPPISIENGGSIDWGYGDGGRGDLQGLQIGGGVEGVSGCTPVQYVRAYSGLWLRL